MDKNREADLCQNIKDAVFLKMQQQYPEGETSLVRRDVHTKAHGCVRATFEVLEGLPSELQIGVFARPRLINCWIRFSAGSQGINSDKKSDVHGMGIKLLGVDGAKVLEDEANATTQDFLLANSPTYFIASLENYSKFAEAMQKGKLLGYFFGWNPFRWKLRELWLVFSSGRHHVTNPLSIRYWSQTPYSLGTVAVKYSAIPSMRTEEPSADLSGKDALSDAMAKSLQTSEICFDFAIQVQRSPKAMPIEDSTKRWNEVDSPFQKVALIRIASQDFSTPERHEFAENLSFTPWHSLVEHKPLGGINQARLAVYRAISDFRHKRNGVIRTEPTDDLNT